ncbi:hypothetical protein FN846DRAFT_892670 [Sphaerosporella brunnea]|uniref:Uncharacterized protein n=1 Tax=Sphaerosporella brunnea TaxID=1250544 RepID=A0A5J5EPS8_9PEZI|nr:hypothetical protein FN846DRAFT_892670 [Sphaerosporella brunnea]
MVAILCCKYSVLLQPVLGLTSNRTCTTRHQQGYSGLPEDVLSSFLPIQPDVPTVSRPIVHLQDADSRFGGKTLMFLELPIAAHATFFVGYIATAMPESQRIIETEFYQWQIGRIFNQEIGMQLSAAVSCAHGIATNVKSVDFSNAMEEALKIFKANSREKLPFQHLHLFELLEHYFPGVAQHDPITKDPTKTPAPKSTRGERRDPSTCKVEGSGQSQSHRDPVSGRPKPERTRYRGRRPHYDTDNDRLCSRSKSPRENSGARAPNRPRGERHDSFTSTIEGSGQSQSYRYPVAGRPKPERIRRIPRYDTDNYRPSFRS